MIDLNPAWRYAKEPIILKRKGAPLMVRLPYSPDNRTWLGSIRKRVRGLAWNKLEKHWECPPGWLNALTEIIITRYGRVWLVQEINEGSACDERCLRATGPDCECRCKGANHGLGHRPAGPTARKKTTPAR